MEDDLDPAVVHNLLLELMGRLDSLAANADAFMSSLQRTLDPQEDLEAFLAYKDRLIGYLERFVSELVVRAFEIEQILPRLDAAGTGQVEALLRLAAERGAADVAPGDEPLITGPGQLGAAGHADAVARKRVRRSFRPEAGRCRRAENLHA